MTPARALSIATCVVVALVLVAPAAQAKAAQPSPSGVRHLHYAFGPLTIKPGQNTIDLAVNTQRPKVNGWITRFKPNLVRANGKVPPVDVIHLHHAVWLVNLKPTWASGEEKTTAELPKGFGWRYKTSDQWLLNHMIHNLTPSQDKVWITWDIDFIPDGSKAAKGIRRIDTQWMDVEGIKAYPVFDVLQGSGTNGRYTFPDQAVDPYGSGPIRNEWVVDHDATLVAALGHLHPGGLWTDLKLTRNGRTAELFRSRAHYYEPAGAVSWDVSMGVTPSDWRVAVKKGDVLSVHATYGTRRGSWYESMGIMPVAITQRPAGGKDPFRTNVAVKGVLTHGHLAENDNHGGEEVGLPDARKLPSGPSLNQVDIDNFVYQQGDLSLPGSAGRPPVVPAGQSLTFLNDDAKKNIFHTITGCRAPCTGATGIAFPLAGGPTIFDSAELGFGPSGFTAAANTDTWQTPPDLVAGTYTYFCRIHPFMRGAFRVQ
jgi:plastocyanin